MLQSSFLGEKSLLFFILTNYLSTTVVTLQAHTVINRNLSRSCPMINQLTIANVSLRETIPTSVIFEEEVPWLQIFTNSVRSILAAPLVPPSVRPLEPLLVGTSVGCSVGACVGASVGASVRTSVGASLLQEVKSCNCVCGNTTLSTGGPYVC